MELEQIKGIGEEQLAESAPLVRALVVQRLEMMWRACQPHIDTTAGKPDPRFIEAGIRITDRLSREYRLQDPARIDNEPDPGSRINERELVKAQVAELESRLPR